MAIKITKQAEGSVLQPTAGKVQLFVDTADDTVKLKDENGDVTPVGSGGGGGLTQDPVVKTSTFTVVAGNSYLISSGSSTISVTLPAGVAGDEVEFRGSGGGADGYLQVSSASENVYGPGGLAIGGGQPYTFSVPGMRVLFRFETVPATGWNVVSDSINTFFASVSDTAPLKNAIIISEGTFGQAYGIVVEDNTILGRYDTDQTNIRGLDIKTFLGDRIVLDTPYQILSTGLANVGGLSWVIDYNGFFTFELYLVVRIDSGTGDLDVAMNYDGTAVSFSLSAEIVSSSTVTTNRFTTSLSTPLTGASQGASTFVTRMRGHLESSGGGDLTLQVGNSNITDAYIDVGSWGVVHRSNLY